MIVIAIIIGIVAISLNNNEKKRRVHEVVVFPAIQETNCAEQPTQLFGEKPIAFSYHGVNHKKRVAIATLF